MKKSKIGIFFENIYQMMEATDQTLCELNQNIETRLDKYNKILEKKRKNLNERTKRFEHNSKKYKGLLKELFVLELYLKEDMEDLIQPQLLKIGKWKETSSFVENFSYENKYEAIDLVKQFYKSILNLSLDHEKLETI